MDGYSAFIAFGVLIGVVVAGGGTAVAFDTKEYDRVISFFGKVSSRRYWKVSRILKKIIQDVNDGVVKKTDINFYSAYGVINLTRTLRAQAVQYTRDYSSSYDMTDALDHLADSLEEEEKFREHPSYGLIEKIFSVTDQIRGSLDAYMSHPDLRNDEPSAEFARTNWKAQLYQLRQETSEVLESTKRKAEIEYKSYATKSLTKEAS